jgi:hypothetical protein
MTLKIEPKSDDIEPPAIQRVNSIRRSDFEACQFLLVISNLRTFHGNISSLSLFTIGYD